MDTVAATLAERKSEVTNGMQGGIASLLGADHITLEARVELALRGVPNDAAFAAAYTDPADRLRVRRRAAIAAILDVLFEHGFDQRLMSHVTVAVVGQEDTCSLLSATRLDYTHDRVLLDGGLPAELVLRPVGRETVDGDRGIKPSRKDMILGLVLIELWQAADANLFRTRTEVRKFVAQQTNMKDAAIKTQRSNFRNGKNCSPAELAYYTEHLDLIRQMAAGCTQSPFALLLPAFRAKCEMAYPRTMSGAAYG